MLWRIASLAACKKREAAPHNKKMNKSWLIPSPNFGIGYLKVQHLTGALGYFASRSILKAKTKDRNLKLDKEFQQFQRDHVVMNKTRREDLGEHMTALHNFLSDNLAGFRTTERQGSHALRTIIRPTTDDAKADADLLVMVKRESSDCKSYVSALKETLEESGLYQDKLVEKNLCVTVQYSERSKLEVDLVPCVESDGRFYVCPRDGDDFRETDGAGYREWFNDRNGITGGNLKRVVRLLKYVRDHREWFDCPSIVLTTLAAETIRDNDRETGSVSTQADTLATVLRRMSENLERTPYPPEIKNPALDSEKFDPKWDRGEYNRFSAIIRRMARDAQDALNETDKEKSVAMWRKVCGEKFAGGQGGNGSGGNGGGGGGRGGGGNAPLIPSPRRREAAPFG